MIQPFVDKFMAASDTLKAEIKVKRPNSYEDLVIHLMRLLHEDYDDKDEDYSVTPDPKRITIIDHGHYQGTQLFIIGASGYQPSQYWSIFVDYGSCSGCDTFESIGSYLFDEDEDELPDNIINQYWTLMLHMVQGMKVV